MAFENRHAAGTALGERLAAEGLAPDRIVTIPDGGYPVARAVADVLDAPVDPIVAEHVPAPGEKSGVVGAVAADGACWRNDEVIERRDFPESQVEQALQRVADRTASIAQQYGVATPPVDPGDNVVLVDDGIETGAAATASLRSLQRAGAADTCVAVPVGPQRALNRLQSELECNRAIALETPATVSSTGAYYEQFDSIDHEDVLDQFDW